MNFFDETTRTFVKAIVPIAFFIALKMAMGLAEDYFGLKTSTVANLVLEVGIAFVAYSTLLHGGYSTAWPSGTKPPFSSFFFRFGLLFFIPLFFALGSLPFLLPLGEISLVLFMGIFGIAALIMLSLFGTMLPAIVDGLDRSWGAALRRGTKIWWFVCWRLIAGPFLVMILLVVIAVSLPMASEFAIDGKIQWLTMLAFIPIMAIGMFASVMVAVILTQAYLRAESVVP